MPEHSHAKAIFMRALDLATENEIAEYLDAACDSPQLRQDVESLLHNC